MAAKRRANGEGSITLRKDGRWLVSFQTGVQANGKPKKLYRYTKTQAEAVQILNRLKLEFSSGVDSAKGNITVSEWCGAWMEHYKANKLAPSTKASYQTNLRVHINKYIGGVALKKLTANQIQYMLDQIYDGGNNSLSLVVKVHNILNGALKKAVSLGMLARNPMEGVELPKDNKREIRVLTVEEQKAFISALEKEDSRVLFMTYLYTGARLGELPALTWRDISFGDRTININKKVIVVHDVLSERKKTYLDVENFCKTESSKRKVYITPALMKILMEHKQKQKENVEALGQNWSEDNLVFPTSNGTIPYPRNIQEKFDRIISGLGFDGVTMHSLRHTYATRLFEADVDIKVISQQLGHKSVKITYDIYVHFIPDRKSRELEKLKEIDKLIA